MSLLKAKSIIASLKRFWKRYIRREFLKYYLGGIYRRGDAHNIFFMASGLSFSLFVCIIPLVLVVFLVIGLVLQKPPVVDEINAFVDHVIPFGNFAAFVKQLIFARVDEFELNKNLAGVAGFVGLFFAASGVFGSMRTILNQVYRVDAGASVIINKLRDFGLVLIVLLYVLLSITILPALQIVADVAGSVDFLERFDLTVLSDLALRVVSFLIIFCALFIMYFFVPTERLHHRAVFISAFSTAVLWEIAKELFGLYIANAVNLKRIYGAYMFGIAVVFWIYYSSIIFIFGAITGQLFRERREKRSPLPAQIKKNLQEAVNVVQK
ncbi:MAG: YihY/virulence factor BrkB family protein [bacterium]